MNGDHLRPSLIHEKVWIRSIVSDLRSFPRKESGEHLSYRGLRSKAFRTEKVPTLLESTSSSFKEGWLSMKSFGNRISLGCSLDDTRSVSSCPMVTSRKSGTSSMGGILSSASRSRFNIRKLGRHERNCHSSSYNASVSLIRSLSSQSKGKKSKESDAYHE